MWREERSAAVGIAGGRSTRGTTLLHIFVDRYWVLDPLNDVFPINLDKKIDILNTEETYEEPVDEDGKKQWEIALKRKGLYCYKMGKLGLFMMKIMTDILSYGIVCCKF